MSTKQRILDEALTLFAENDYDETGVDMKDRVTGSSFYD